MSYTFDGNIISDLHKDARGFRPSQVWWDNWKCSDEEFKQCIWDGLLVELNEEISREAREQAKALLNLQARICETRALGAASDKEALKWIMQAEQFDEHDFMYGPDYFCYHFGIAYSDKSLFPIQEAMNEMLKAEA